MKMKSICGHPNSEGKEPPLLNSVSDGGVSSTELSFEPCILRGFLNSLKINPG